MKIFQARETISNSMRELSNGDISTAVIEILKSKVRNEALAFIGDHDEDVIEQIRNAMDVETEYLERGKSWRITVSVAVPERKELFKR